MCIAILLNLSKLCGFYANKKTLNKVGTMNQIDIRQIRVFISSTFEDMKDERDYLIKKVFPELRQMAAEREVTFIDVDLRWGITEEQAKKGKVIDICFNEIDKSIPFFIGIVGNRYGWCPEDKDVAIDDCLHYEDIKRYMECHLSATEMEIQYAVLEREQPMYAAFYIDSREADSSLIDYPDKLKTLKEKIINNQRYIPEYYSSSVDLGEKVKIRFKSLLDKLFPASETLSEIERIELTQRINLNALCSAYIPDEKRFEEIDSFVNDSQKRQLLIVGDSGVGKSAFVAEWVKRNQFQRNIVYYSVGCGGNNSDSETVLNQLAILVNHKCTGFIENKGISLNSSLDSFAESNEKLIVVLDAFNQIELRETETTLSWFPEPKGNVKFIITITTDTDSIHFNPSHLNSRHILLSRDGSAEYVFRKLSIDTRKEIICSILKKHGKEPVYVNDIASSKLFQNTLALRILLDELILYPKHETIKKEIKKYLNCKSLDSFILSVINRYEQDYGQSLVRKALSLLAISEKGFNEQELKDLINADLKYLDGNSKVNAISPLEWSQFFWAFRDNLSIREGGLFGFSHQLVRNAILEKYVSRSNNELVLSLRKLIVDTFKDEHSPRAFLELRRQYQELEMYEELLTLLGSSDAYYYLINNHWGALSESWEELCLYKKNPYPLSELINAWKRLPEGKKAETYNDTELILAAIISDQQGHLPPDPCPEEFARMKELCIPYQKETQDRYNYTYSAGVGYLDTSTQLEHALSLFLRSLSILEETNLQKWSSYYENLIECYGRIAQCYHILGKKSEEADYLKCMIEPCKIHYGEYHKETQFWYYQVGFTLFENQSYVEAIENLQKSLEIAERRQDIQSVLNVCNGLVQCYVEAFKKDEKENRNDFLTDSNYSKYLDYYEQMAYAMKKLGQTKEYKAIMKDIEEMRRGRGPFVLKIISICRKIYGHIWHRLRSWVKKI